jgi:hypothetical protein
MWSRTRKLWVRLPPRSGYFHRTSTYPSEPARALFWGVLSLAVVGLLVGFAALVGRGADHIHVGVLVDSFVHTVTQPAVAVPIAFALLALCGRICRTARLAWLAWRPGPIVVSDFMAPLPIAGITPGQVTAMFRGNLALLRLDSAVASPGAAPEASFLDVLDTDGGFSSNDILRTLLTLLRASWPAHAFAVEGTLQERAGPRGCGLTVHVVRLPGEPAALVEVWESSWDEASRTAADGAIAALLPRTRLCKGPWSGWQGFQPPPELFTAYRKAGAFVAGRRYDEALGRYREALVSDPTNPTIALQMGQLQEKIGMFLGALVTYQRLLALDNPGEEPFPRGLYRRAALREWRRSVRIAKYRQLVLLGQGTVVREWCGPFEGEPTNYRALLRDYFRSELRPLTSTRGDPAADAIAGAIGELIKEQNSGDEELVASVQRRLMPFVYQAGYELQRELSRTELRPWAQPLTRRTAGLTLASLETRAKLAERLEREERWPEDLVAQLDRGVHWAGWRPGFWAGWRPVQLRRWTWQQHYNAACHFAIPLALESDRDEALRAHAAAHVDAPAAATAAPQLATHAPPLATHAPPLATHAPAAPAPGPRPWSLPVELRDELARCAVNRLERAASRADADFIAARRAWVLEEDHDLRGLRERLEFKAFAADYFPSAEDPSGAIFGGRVATRAPDAHLAVRHSQARVAQTEYVHHLLGAIAAGWHELWHQRASHEGIADLHKLVSWWSEEAALWALFGEVATHRYDGARRQRLLEMANEIALRDKLIPVIASYGAGDGAALAPHGAHNGASLAAGAAPRHNGEDPCRARPEVCLAIVATWFTPPAGLAQWHGRQFQRRVELLRRADAEALRLGRRSHTERLCGRQAAVWQALDEWFSGAVLDEDEARERLRRRLSDAQHLWMRAERRSQISARWQRAAKGLSSVG